MQSNKRQEYRHLDAGIRTVGEMNYSSFVTIPKLWIKNYLTPNKLVQLTIAPDGTLSITPVEDKK